MRRVNESVRAVVAEGVAGLKDPRIGMVTVTGVRVSPDLGDAIVFVSVLGSEKKREATMAGLTSAHGVLQGRIGQQLSLRRTPRLTFAYDDSVERGVRMTKLIDDLAADLPGGAERTTTGKAPTMNDVQRGRRRDPGERPFPRRRRTRTPTATRSGRCSA